MEVGLDTTSLLQLSEELGFVGRDGSERGFEGVENVVLWESDGDVF
jgi:hypothetical protein